MVTSGFFNSVNGDRKYNAEQMSAIFNGIINDGVFVNVGTAFAVTADVGNTVIVGIGRAWIDSTWIYNDAPIQVQLEASDILTDRIDAVVLETDHSAPVRTGSIKVIKGTAQTNPVRPNMNHSVYVHQYPLAYILRPKNSTAITQANITYMVGTSELPFVTGILETMDIDALVAQWGAEWDAWFNGVKDELSEDVAGNLQNQIDALEDRQPIIFGICSEEGWYRIAKSKYTNPDTKVISGRSAILSCLISIKRMYSNTKPEVMNLALLTTTNKTKFEILSSLNDVQLIDGIRCVKDENHLYIDIHYGQTVNNNVSIIINDGFFYSNSQHYKYYWTPYGNVPFQSSNSLITSNPADSDILAVYDIPANVSGDMSRLKDMTGATSDMPGKSGLVPQPGVGANERYLRGDATWQLLPNTSRGWRTIRSVSGVGWCRIALTVPDIENNLGIFVVNARANGRHGVAVFTAGTSYGNIAGTMINQLAFSKYSTTNMTKARIVYTPSYNSNCAFVDVYLSANYNTDLTVDFIGYGWSGIPKNAIIIPNNGPLDEDYNSKEITFVVGGVVADTNIMGGVVPVSHGGTGADSAGIAVNNLEAQSLSPTVTIPSNSNLNDYSSPGSYYVPSSTVAATIVNSPFTGSGYMLWVYRPYGSYSSNLHRMQIAMRYSGQMYFRYRDANTWYDWSTINLRSIIDKTGGEITGLLSIISGIVFKKSSTDDDQFVIRKDMNNHLVIVKRTLISGSVDSPTAVWGERDIATLDENDRFSIPTILTSSIRPITNEAEALIIRFYRDDSYGTRTYITSSSAGSRIEISAGTSQSADPQSNYSFRNKNDGLVMNTPCTSTKYNTNSSRLIKENIAELTDEHALKILELSPKTFDFKEGFGEKNQVGLIAEEVLEIMPETVTVPKDYDETEFDETKGPMDNEILSIDYSKFVPDLIKLAQIQQEHIEIQDRKIEDLEARLAQVESLLNKL